MKSQPFSGKRKKPKILIIRRVVGASMEPTLLPGKFVIGTGRFKDINLGDIVVVHHDNMEKIKRVTQINEGKIFISGDNPAKSTDSRQFGWLPKSSITAKVIWPFD